MNTALNRTTLVQLTNKSGSNVSQGDVVVLSSTDNDSFISVNTEGYNESTIGVVLEPNGIPNNEVGGVAVAGWVPKVNLDSTADTGDFVKTSSTPYLGTVATFGEAGAFGQTLSSGSSPSLVMSTVTSQAGTPVTMLVDEVIYDQTLTSGYDFYSNPISVPSGYESVEVNMVAKVDTVLDGYANAKLYLNGDDNEDHYTNMEFQTYNTGQYSTYYSPESAGRFHIPLNGATVSGYYNFVTITLPDVSADHNYKQMISSDYMHDFTGGTGTMVYRTTYQLWSGGSNTHINSLIIDRTLAAGSIVRVTGKRIRDVLVAQ